MKKIIIVILGLSFLGCTTVDVDYEEGVKPLGQDTFPGELKKLFDDLERTATAQQGILVKTWRQWLGDRSVPLLSQGMVTFVYWDENTQVQDVVLCADFNGYSTEDRLFRFKNTRLFYKSFKLEERKSVDYRFGLLADEKLEYKLDPMNPRLSPGKPLKSQVSLESGFQGRLEILPQVPPQSGAKISARDIQIYLPKAYFANPEGRFPVVYAMDGQNLWTSDEIPYGGWQADKTLELLVGKNQIKPVILVGIPSGALRKEEYVGVGAYFGMPVPSGKKALVEENLKIHEDFSRYVVEVVKPLVDKTYRTRPGREDTSVMGSSFGAGISLYLAFQYSQIFSRVAALSVGNYAPGMPQWEDKPYRIVDFLLKKILLKTDTRVYLDCGTSSVDELFLPEAQKLAQGFKALGWTEGPQFKWVQDNGAPHNEKAWAARLPDVFTFLLK